jgi:hypothetical protein
MARTTWRGDMTLIETILGTPAALPGSIFVTPAMRFHTLRAKITAANVVHQLMFFVS